MTAETLKPFITPTSAVNNFPAKHSDATHSKLKIRYILPIVLIILAAALVIGILSLTIWQTVRVQKLESDLNKLNRDMESLKQRLGIHYLDDMAEFQKEYTNMIIENPNEVDELEGVDEDDDDTDDDDYDNDNDNNDDIDYGKEDDDDYSESTDSHLGAKETNWDDYLELIKKEKNDNQSNETESPASTSEDNVFDDFTSYSDAKKKKERKSRSIADMRNELQSIDMAQNQSQAKTEQHLKKSDATTESQTPHHHSHKSHSRSRQSRRRLLVRKAKSAELNAGNKRNVGNSGTPAAHFHLNRMVPHPRHGDMYVGHATASMGNQWEQHFSVNDGVLTVHKAGLYYVYAQICYNDAHDQNGFIIYHGDNQFLQCLNTVPTNIPLKVHTCHTSGLIQLRDNEQIHLRDIHQDRNVVLRDFNNRSYFGIIKI
ncbi:protein eiger isoform X2 [Drosophila innubila]|uniref:protein eiger isoform X2 n=1 Tax=Drosophila innubila TaxID=198719 RepID=UPI00148BFD1E|nr:protein eiger isoform X2 [Drosophila innubila]